MQDASGFGIFGQVTNTIGFNVPIGFSKPSGGGVVVINYLVTQLDDNITTESNDPLILEQ
jgi:two-component sensor histidine kinase